MSDPEKRWPHAEAYAVALHLVEVLSPYCERIEIAGSLRSMKPHVGDIELLYISRTTTRQVDMFQSAEVSLMDEALSEMLAAGTLTKRVGKGGHTAWGKQNKLATHVASGIGVDLFATREESWHNALVCRTGPAESNMRIATRARARGLHWHPVGDGFHRLDIRVPEPPPITCEADVFGIVGLPCELPEDRR